MLEQEKNVTDIKTQKEKVSASFIYQYTMDSVEEFLRNSTKVEVKLAGFLAFGGFLFRSIMLSDPIVKTPYGNCYSCLLLYVGACATALSGTILFAVGLIGKEAGAKPSIDSIINEYRRKEKSQDKTFFYIINTVKESLPKFREVIRQKQSYQKKGLILIATSMVLLFLERTLEIYLKL
jgi:hypothetical protein